MPQCPASNDLRTSSRQRVMTAEARRALPENSLSALLVDDAMRAYLHSRVGGVPLADIDRRIEETLRLFLSHECNGPIPVSRDIDGVWHALILQTHYTGIVLCIEDSSAAGNSWVLTGDCDYRYFWSAMRLPDPVALIAPHHGADLMATSRPPSRAPGSYRRIVYSFGPNNTHSGASHPTSGGITAHDSAGWKHGTWPTAPPPAPGHSTPGADALATCVHLTTVRDSIVVGWILPSTPLHACGGTRCTTNLKQS